MRSSIKLYQLLIVATTLTLSSLAFAYDEDTHFYMTYAMARYAGIKHEVASEMALANQWMDESAVSSPLSVSDLKQYVVRYLLHFPGNKLNPKSADSICQQSSFNFVNDFLNLSIDVVQGTLSGHDLNVVTKKNHPMASEMIREGFENGNLTLAAGGLHILMDSFSHAGHNALLGHAVEGHHADRPFLFKEKYYEMIRTLFKAMVAFRRLLPPEYIDKTTTLNEGSGQLNYQQAADILAENFILLLEQKSRILQNYFINPAYTKFSVRYILRLAYNENLLKPVFRLGGDVFGGHIEYFLKQIDFEKGLLTEELIIEVVKLLLDIEKNPASVGLSKAESFNYDKIFSFIGGGLKADPENLVVDSFGNQDELIKFVVESLIKGHVPRKFSDEHKFEFEIEGPIREKEMELRTTEVKQFIRRLFAVDIRMISLQDQKDLASKKIKLADLQNSKGNRILVTKSALEKKQWDAMIMQYMFPNSHDSYLSLGRFKESFCTHEIAKANNKVYQNYDLFDQHVKAGRYRMLLITDQIKLPDRWTYIQGKKP